MSSKQVLSKLQDLGAFVESPSSTVEASTARQLRNAVTGQRPGSAPPSSLRRVAVGRPRPHVPQPRTPAPRPDQTDEGSHDESFDEAYRRIRAQGTTRPPRRPRPRKTTGLATYIAEHTGYGGGSYNPMRSEIANGWAMQWREQWFEDAESIEWLRAGLNANEAAQAGDMARNGWTPETLRRAVRGETVLSLWRKRVFSIEDIDRMLREQDGDEAR